MRIPVQLSLSAEPTELWLEIKLPGGKRLRIALPLETINEALASEKPSRNFWSWEDDAVDVDDLRGTGAEPT